MINQSSIKEKGGTQLASQVAQTHCAQSNGAPSVHRVVRVDGAGLLDLLQVLADDVVQGGVAVADLHQGE